MNKHTSIHEYRFMHMHNMYVSVMGLLKMGNVVPRAGLARSISIPGLA